jgi:uncharacterized lipoprotein YddW (UPF0748 family)
VLRLVLMMLCVFSTPAFARLDSVRVDATAAMRSVDDLWVPRGALADPASVDSVVARAARMGVRSLLVQVVGRGDAVHRSDLLPRAEFLDGIERRHPGWDPLDHLLAGARREGLEVHAWMNCMLVWSAPRPPRDPRHVVRAHPEWLARMRDGRKLGVMSAEERARRGLEGVFLSPAHPGVRAWLAAVAGELCARYPIDGLHLDYIRQPTPAIGGDPTTRARFALEHGVDPLRVGHLDAAARARVGREWEAFQRAEVTAVVQAIADSARAARPGVRLSAAVIADTATAERANMQSWRRWVHDGLLDRAFLMCYAMPVQTVMNQLAAFAREFGATDRVVPGIAVYNTGPAAAALKIKGARALGFPRVAVYSYEALFGGRDTWQALNEHFAPGLN